MIGNGLLLTKIARLVVTGNSGNISTTAYELFNKTDFPLLTFSAELDGLMTFDENSGEFTFVDGGILQMFAIFNLQASVASAEIDLIPEFNPGTGWVVGSPRRKVLTAITPDQSEFHGTYAINKGDKFRFSLRAFSGNIAFKTETLDPGGPLESILPAAIFYLELDRLTSRLIS